MRTLFYISLLILLMRPQVNAQAELQKSVVSNGGGQSSDNNKVVQLSIGQPMVGIIKTETVKGDIGFWHVTIKSVESTVRTSFKEQISHPGLSQNYPNPFHEQTQFDLYLPTKEKIKMSVYNNEGMLIDVLLNEELYPGTYEISWKVYDLPEGIYFCELLAGDYKITKSMILVK